MKAKYRFYALLRSYGYSPNEALWNVRHCSDYFWERLTVLIQTEFVATV